MAGEKIADFFAQIGIKVDEKSIKRLGTALDNIERGLHNAEVSAKKSFKTAIQPAKDLNKAVKEGNRALNKRAEVTRRITQMNERASLLARRASSRAAFEKMGLTPWAQGGKARTAQQKAWQKNFQGALKGMVGGSITNKARKAQQGMYDSLFGAIDDTGRQKGLAVAQKEYLRSMERLRKQEEKAATVKERAARVAENLAKREVMMAERTAAIREAGARRASAIIQGAEIRAQAIASRTQHRAGRPSGLGMAGFGGAVGAASSGIAGFLPGFGAAYSLMNANRINQELQGQRLAMTAVMGGGAAGGEQQNWLRNLAETIGFDFRQTQPAFTRMLASGTSSGLSTKSVQNIFQGVSEYGRVMGLDTESMKGGMRAVEQMMN